MKTTKTTHDVVGILFVVLLSHACISVADKVAMTSSKTTTTSTGGATSDSVSASQHSEVYADSDGKRVFSKEYRAQRTVNGVIYSYSNKQGQETIHVKGDSPESFDFDELLESFRQVLGIDPNNKELTTDNVEEKVGNPYIHIKKSSTMGSSSSSSSSSSSTTQANDGDATTTTTTSSSTNTQTPTPTTDSGETTTGTSGSLYDTVSSFFGTDFTGEQLLDQYEVETRHLIAADDVKRNEAKLDRVMSDLHDVLTEKEILRKRQAELGSWISENKESNSIKQFPTIHELVDTEIDRLDVLHYRLDKMHSKLKAQKDGLMTALAEKRKQFAKTTEMMKNIRRIASPTPVIGQPISPSDESPIPTPPIG
eukprot:TRINITY_DN10822_c0_g1_i3.p1 TRINITY_DN10822_c0_g1~~TRINITY_DN10822_c0_g1_i3.p1  ORF type:complete len:367 (-),score=140.50 TRINITY_DN10822_c0_g1_i3:528-1628(-)